MNIGTFADWVTIGASIGIKAFFALFVFGLFCAAVLGVLSLMSYAAKGGKANEREKRRRPY